MHGVRVGIVKIMNLQLSFVNTYDITRALIYVTINDKFVIFFSRIIFQNILPEYSVIIVLSYKIDFVLDVPLTLHYMQKANVLSCNGNGAN